MIEIIGEVPVMPEQVIDAYNIIRNECASHTKNCVGCPLNVEMEHPILDGVKEVRCAISDVTPEMWTEVKYVGE